MHFGKRGRGSCFLRREQPLGVQPLAQLVELREQIPLAGDPQPRDRERERRRSGPRAGVVVAPTRHHDLRPVRERPDLELVEVLAPHRARQRAAGVAQLEPHLRAARLEPEHLAEDLDPREAAQAVLERRRVLADGERAREGGAGDAVHRWLTLVAGVDGRLRRGTAGRASSNSRFAASRLTRGVQCTILCGQDRIRPRCAPGGASGNAPPGTRVFASRAIAGNRTLAWRGPSLGVERRERRGVHAVRGTRLTRSHGPPGQGPRERGCDAADGVLAVDVQPRGRRPGHLERNATRDRGVTTRRGARAEACGGPSWSDTASSSNNNTVSSTLRAASRWAPELARSARTSSSFNLWWLPAGSGAARGRSPRRGCRCRPRWACRGLRR